MARNTYSFVSTLGRVTQHPGFYAKYLLGHAGRVIRYHKSRLLNQQHLEPQVQKTLELMWSDHQDPSSKLWKRLSSEIKMEILGRGLEDFRRSFINNNYGGYRKMETALERSAAWQYYNTVKAKDSLGILDHHPEPALGKPFTINFEGKQISWDYLQAIDEFYNIIETFGIQPGDELVVCEIGGGYGRLAQLFAKLMPNCHYLLVDIPSSLAVAYYYMSQIAPDDIRPYESSRMLSTYTREYLLEKRLTFMLPHQLRKVQGKVFDLVINIDSFQELTPSIVQDYFRLIQAHGKRCLYLKNSNHPIHNFIDDVDFSLIDYPSKIGMKVIKSQISIPYPDMVEQFILLNGSSATKL